MSRRCPPIPERGKLRREAFHKEWPPSIRMLHREKPADRFATRGFSDVSVPASDGFVTAGSGAVPRRGGGFG